jgi:hypothetical protein
MPSTQSIVRTDFAAAVVQIAEERKIEAEDIYEAIRQALVSAYRKQMGELDESFYYYVELNKESGAAKIFQAPITRIDEETEEILEWDESKAEEVTPAGFGLIAAQTANKLFYKKFGLLKEIQLLLLIVRDLARSSLVKYCACKVLM